MASTTSLPRSQKKGEPTKTLPALATVSPVQKSKSKHRQHALVGVRIRKQFEDGSWSNGEVYAVKEKAKVKFRNKIRQELALDQKLEWWKTSYQMYKLASKCPGKRDPSLFPRGRNSKPYTLSQFMGLVQYVEQRQGGATIEELEASHLVRKKPGSKNTEVYGRMLPCATQVSGYV